MTNTPTGDYHDPEGAMQLTPTWTGITVGNGESRARVNHAEFPAVCTVVLTLGSSSQVVGPVSVGGVPLIDRSAALCRFADTSARLIFPGVIDADTGEIGVQYVDEDGGLDVRELSAVVPFAWSELDRIVIIYRVADGWPGSVDRA